MRKRSKEYANLWNEYANTSASEYLSKKFTYTKNGYAFTNTLRERAMIDSLDLKKDDVVLDVGCASGVQLFRISAGIKKGIGIDVGDEYLSVARNEANKLNLNNLDFIKGEVEQLPFEDGYFSKILIGEVLEHLMEVDLAVMELKRVLKPGGILVASVPNRNGKGTLFRRFYYRFLRGMKFEPLTDFSVEGIKIHGDSHVREFTPERLSELMRRHRLSVEKIIGINIVDFPMFHSTYKSVIRKSKILLQSLLSFECYVSKKALFPSLCRGLVIKVRKEVV